jgi:hypothetical protein
MNLTEPNSHEILAKTHRKFEAELLREMHMENTQRSILCYGWFALSAVGFVLVFLLVLLMGLQIISLPERIILALIGATIANGSAMFLTIIKSLFSRKR